MRFAFAAFIVIGNALGAEFSLLLLIFGAPILLGLLIGYAIAKRRHSRYEALFRYAIAGYFSLPGVAVLVLIALDHLGFLR